MPKVRNALNEPYIRDLKRALARVGAENKDSDKKENIEACIEKVEKEKNPIKWDEVVWAVRGKAFIDKRRDQVRKVHTEHIHELNKVYAMCTEGSEMMADPGNTSSSSKPQPPPQGAAFGCIPSKDAKPLPNPTSAPAAASRRRSSAERSTSAASVSRSQSSAKKHSSTQTEPDFGVPDPKDNEKKKVALYTERMDIVYGMHKIWAKIRMPPEYDNKNPPKEARIDMLYDTGSTRQGITQEVFHQIVVDESKVSFIEQESRSSDGKITPRRLVLVQIRLFEDEDRKKPLDSWFDAWGCVDMVYLLSGGEMRFRTGLHFTNLPDVKSPLFVGKSMWGVFQRMQEWQTQNT